MLPSLNESPLPVTYAAVLFFIPKAVLISHFAVASLGVLTVLTETN